MALMIISISDVFAESKWSIENPKVLSSSEGLILTNYVIDKKNYKIEVTIPEDYNKEELIISPDFFSLIADYLDNRTIYAMPGDTFNLSLTIINKSKYNYLYKSNSFNISPSDQSEFDVITNHELFNGLNVSELNQYPRMINKAFKDLGVKKYIDLADTSLDRLLINKNYKGISELGKYMLDYYNNLYNTNNTLLEQFSDDQIEEILGNNNTIDYGHIVLENNPLLIELHYNYFYNSLLGYSLNNIELNDSNTKDYSIGNYMRNHKMSESIINESLGYIDAENNFKSALHINGLHTKNAYAGYEFDMEMNMSFEVEKGNVIVNYIDELGDKIDESDAFNGIVDNDYKVSPKDIKDYEILMVEGNESGKYNKEDIIVNYIYKKVSVDELVTKEEKIPQTGLSNTSNAIGVIVFFVLALVLLRTKSRE